MRIFVTGATGFVGSAIVQELRSAGHEVLGLARSDRAAEKIASLGAEVHRGSLEDVESLRRGVADADGVIHTGFNHDFSRFLENCRIDRRAILAMGEELAGSTRPILVTSGLAFIAPPGRLATEEDEPWASVGSYPRASEAAAAELLARGVRVAIMRLPPSVHGEGDHGFVPALISIARERGVSAYMGDGLNAWSGVHRLDAARAFRLALGHVNPGRRFHVVGEAGVAFKDIASTIARQLDVPLISVPSDRSPAHFGWLALFAAMDMAASSARTRALLQWKPMHPGLLDDIGSPAYYSAG
jgi:nucleoside-diphosphate-sugar epimerase